jgi:hypothetical protein
MENQQKKNIALNLWGLWCQLPQEQRKELTSQLGQVGQILNIATNVQKIIVNRGEQNQNAEGDVDKGATDEGDIIEAEWEEVKK